MLNVDKGAGSWDEGTNTEATGMFFRALRNLAERYVDDCTLLDGAKNVLKCFTYDLVYMC